MSRNLIRFSVPLIGSAALALAFVGCSSDDPAPAQGTGGATASGGSSSGGGGATSTGGKAVGGGGASGGGGGAAGTPADPYDCQKAAPRDPGGTVAKDAACCGGAGTCTDPATLTDPLKSALGHDTCLPTLKCAPKATAGDAGTPAKCTATTLAAGLEGRCLPKCFVLGNPNANQLKADGCTGTDVVCAPCYNPMDAADTGACTQNGDSPDVTKKPTPYATCGTYDGGSAGGVCVPKTLVDASGNASAPNLKQDDCASATDRCVPTLKATDSAACFEKCTTTLTALGKQYGPGACVPSYIVRDVNPQGLAILKKDTCAGADELCAPCLDPLSMPTAGVPTHSCE